MLTHGAGEEMRFARVLQRFDPDSGQEVRALIRELPDMDHPAEPLSYAFNLFAANA
jgi:hypothetical protein